ncbi:MAG: PAS domain-containing protein, partial [Rivularia sp. (in: cyanobacteria)]
GYSESELLDLSWQNITHSDDLENCNELMTSFLNCKTKDNSIQKRLVHQNGEFIKVKINLSVVCDRLHIPQYFLCVVEQ